MNTDNLIKKVSDMNIQAYDKGCNDGIDVCIFGFETLKEQGHKFLSVDTIISTLKACKEIGNNIKTEYSPQP